MKWARHCELGLLSFFSLARESLWQGKPAKAAPLQPRPGTWSVDGHRLPQLDSLMAR